MAAYQYAFVMKELNKTFSSGKEILKNVWLSFLPGAKIGILGPNGAGKSTLLKIMAGIDKEYNGEAWAAEGIKVGYLPQEPVLMPDSTVLDNITEGVQEVKKLLERFQEIAERFAEDLTAEDMDILLEEQAILQEKIEAANGWEIDRTIEIAMDALRCPEGNSIVNNLSGGEKRRVALCRLLLQKPDLLLLDEPTNHLDAESVEWLEKFLQNYTGTVVLITHDRYFLDNVVGWILELDRGQALPYEGNYSAWLEQKQKRLETEQRQEKGRQKILERELAWIQQSPKARQAKNKARIVAYDKLLQEEYNTSADQTQLIIPAGPRLGSLVIEAENISKSFGNTLFIDQLNFRLPPGGIVGIIGANGAGKSTLFKMIIGQELPQNGTFKIGDTVKLGYVDQSRDALNAHKTVWEEISDGLDEVVLGKKKIPSRAYCAQFNFKGPDQQKKVGQLSGGERNRVHLALMLKSGANVLLLDEPTNDLDVDTLRALEEALLEFAGCAVVISHDRWFLDRIATHILAFEGNSKVVWFEGNYADYQADKQRRLGRDGMQPKPLKFKPLTR